MGEPAVAVEAEAGTRMLTGKRKQHIRAKTKLIVTNASLFENWARASCAWVQEAPDKKRATATAWRKSYQTERA